MIVDQPSQTCVHAACTCEVPPGQMSCSAHCANAATEKPETAEARCHCGHPQCAGTEEGRTS